ncbi:MAG: diacylglycerol kinase family lipid kinase [Acidimicrobiia bacterium]|nr:diacylglycerol kinase family lipid kinase [Acidimicrobiia bacterium]
MRLLLIVNTSASAVTARARVVIRKALSADHDVTTAETSRRGNATRLAQDAAAAGYDAVVVLGGDGTLNEAANGLAGSPTALATLPGGSTNVFARTLGIAQDPVEATGELLSSLARGSRRRIGLGSVNGRYFLFHVGMGFDAAVVSQVERRAALKRYAGHPLFVYAAFSTWFRHYDRSRPRLRVEIPGRPRIDDAYMAICLNSNPYTYLGNIPLNLAPDADLDRGLVVATFRSLEMVLFLGLVASVLRRGSHFRRHRTVDYRPDLTEATVTGHGPFPYQVDGDYLGEAERLAFRHEPDALTVVVPAVP